MKLYFVQYKVECDLCPPVSIYCVHINYYLLESFFRLEPCQTTDCAWIIEVVSIQQVINFTHFSSDAQCNIATSHMTL